MGTKVGKGLDGSTVGRGVGAGVGASEGSGWGRIHATDVSSKLFWSRPRDRTLAEPREFAKW